MASDVSEGLTPIEEERLIATLGGLGTRMSDALFNAVAAKFVLTGVSTFILRRRDGGAEVEILLTNRDASFPGWEGQWHVHGSMLRANDTPGSYEDALKRVEADELGVTFITAPWFVTTLLCETARGPINEMIFVCQIEGEPPVGKFFGVGHLPEDLIPSHHPLITAAVRHFLERN